jgi:hypothetical protein
MSIKSFSHLFVKIAFLLLLAACRPESKEPILRPTSTMAVTPTVEVVVPSNVNSLIGSLTDAGAEVVNDGRTGQGLFPDHDIFLWHLNVDGFKVNVFEFRDSAAREAVSNNILPNGSEYIVVEGDTTVTTHWDGEGVPHFWALDNLIVNYWGEDSDLINMLTTVLGQQFADGSKPYRPEAGSGAIAGIGQYGISFQYDPYLADNLTWEVSPARPSTGPDDFTFYVMPEHLTFTLLDTYAEDWTQYHQTVNIPEQPQIVVFPLDAYVNMNEMAIEQVAALDTLLSERPNAPEGVLPYLPPPNGHQDLQVQMAYLSFKNGEGVRYLTQFNQEPRQINNQEIFYTFQGITADHAYYVSVFFPVRTAALPDNMEVEDWDAFSINYAAYLSETVTVLNQLGTADFTPDLTLLDAVVQSLLVEPDVDLSGQ